MQHRKKLFLTFRDTEPFFEQSYTSLCACSKAIKKLKASIGQNESFKECNPSLELQEAKKELIKMEQLRFVACEINCLKTKKSIEKESSLRNLVLKLLDGVLYSVSRIDFDELLMIMPNDSLLTISQ